MIIQVLCVNVTNGCYFIGKKEENYKFESEDVNHIPLSIVTLAIVIYVNSCICNQNLAHRIIQSIFLSFCSI